MHVPALRSVRVSQAIAYHFGFDHGWAIFTVNDATGELNLQSDWGDYAYRWPARPESLGAENLTAFLVNARADSDYVARKLFGGDTTEFDADATAEALRDAIVSRRRKNEIDRDVARAAWDELARWGPSSYDDFHNTPDEISEALYQSAYEYARTCSTGRFLFVRDFLIPLFVDHLRTPTVAQEAA